MHVPALSGLHDPRFNFPQKRESATSGTKALSRLNVQGYDVFAHNGNKAGKINTTHMSRRYLENGEYRTASQLNMIAKEFSEPNRGYAFAYKEYLELNNRKARTIARRLGDLRFILRVLPKDAKLATKKDIENVVMAINKGKTRDYNGNPTNKDLAILSKRKLKEILRAFYRWLYNSDHYPEIVNWIKVDRDVSNKLPEDLLNEEEVKKLIENCKNQRDKTIIALLWDTGMRVGELLNLRIRDISMSDGLSHGIVRGKTGERKVPLVFSVPYLANYLNDFRKNCMQDDPLLTTFEHNTSSNVPIDYMHIRKMLGDLKERTKLQKRLYPHLFRHSRATYYANFLTEQQAKRYFGWSGGSTMVARYTHLASKDIDNAILKANGMTVNDSGESLQPKFSVKQCEKCHLKNEITAKYCTKCGTFLDKSIVQKSIENDEAKEDLDTLKEALALLITKLDPETRGKLIQIVKN